MAPEFSAEVKPVKHSSANARSPEAHGSSRVQSESDIRANKVEEIGGKMLSADPSDALKPLFRSSVARVS